jgi:uncharacterized protein (TIGR03032 family)
MSVRPSVMWKEHATAWRDPRQVVAGWADATAVEPKLLHRRVRGPWWELLEELDVCLVASREYEHFLVGLAVCDGRPIQTYMPLPHPSGIAVDERSGVVHVASTRNPNVVLSLEPVTGVFPRADAAAPDVSGRPLVPVRSRTYRGSLYLHDLALIGGRLYGNAVGQNAVVQLDEDGHVAPVWWPTAIERDGTPDFGRNYLQLNSIAAGQTVEGSFFSASAERPSARRPGHLNFPVDGRGVVFSGETREPIARGLTRPHSARLRRGELWVLNSGYGEIGRVVDGAFEPVARLPGWTRGLCFHGDHAFVATSRVIPRFHQYAPGLDERRSVCGVHAVDLKTATVTASLSWPMGNQIFAVELLSRRFTGGFAFGASGAAQVRDVFYSFTTKGDE